MNDCFGFKLKKCFNKLQILFTKKSVILAFSTLAALGVNEFFWLFEFPKAYAFFFDIQMNLIPEPPADPEIVLVDLYELNSLEKYKTGNGNHTHLDGITETIKTLKKQQAKLIILTMPTQIIPNFPGSQTNFYSTISNIPNFVYLDSDLDISPITKVNKNIYELGGLAWDYTTGAMDRVARRFVIECKPMQDFIYRTAFDLLNSYNFKLRNFEGMFERSDCYNIHSVYRKANRYSRINVNSILTNQSKINIENKIVILGIDNKYDTGNYRKTPISKRDLMDFTAMEAVANMIDNVKHMIYPRDASRKPSKYLGFFFILLIFLTLFLESPIKSVFASTTVVLSMLLVHYLILFIGNFYFDPTRTVFSLLLIQYIGLTISFLIYFKKQALLTAKLTYEVKQQQTQNRAITVAAKADLGLKIATKVAHDIRSPLMAIQTVASMLTDEKSQSFVKILRDSADRLTRIAESLLSSYRRSGDSNQPLKNVELKSTFTQISKTITLVWPESQIDLNLENNLPILNVDSTDFERSVQNLLINAIEAGSGKTHIQIHASYSQPIITILIKDNGIGIPEQIHHKLFQEGATFGKTQGTGLGLYQCKKFFNDIGGKLLLIETSIKGTTFEIQIPVQNKKDFELKVNSRIFVIDDSPEVLALWSHILNKYQFDFKTFEKPDELMKNIDWIKGASLISDLVFNNSEFNGLDLCEYFLSHNIKNIEESDRPILCTSLAQSKTIQDIAKSKGYRLMDKNMIHRVSLLK